MKEDSRSGACSAKEYAGKSYYCSVELTLHIVGGKWKPIILWRLAGREGVRFGELRRLIPNVTQKMLTQQLRELESDGMILRVVYAQSPPKVEYSLTGLGQSVLPVLERLCAWGREFEARIAEQGAFRSVESA
jgi:DNA-binding HxlR family transcriptional regulator